MVMVMVKISSSIIFQIETMLNNFLKKKSTISIAKHKYNPIQNLIVVETIYCVLISTKNVNNKIFKLLY